MLGKTVQWASTTRLLTWQTVDYLELEDHVPNWNALRSPEQVMEIAFGTACQRSPRSKAGERLPFASTRVLRYARKKWQSDGRHDRTR